MNELNIMDWHHCEEKFIRKVKPDLERIKSLRKKALQRLQRAQSTSINEDTVAFVVEDYYEVIKELLIAYLLKNGMRSTNHQCLFSYFYKTNPNYELETIIIRQMSYFRNRLCYYGDDIPLNFYEKNQKKFIVIIKIIEELLS